MNKTQNDELWGADEICLVCGEKKSAHVVTDQGPYTHPKMARGEGTYVLRARGTLGFGIDCRECSGPCSMDHGYERWDFVPTSKITDCRPGSGVLWVNPAAFAWVLMAMFDSELRLFISIDFEVAACRAELSRRNRLELEGS